MKFYRLISFITLLAILVPTAGAVTDREMEQARTIATQCYLRYANDGSGYLDDVKAASMAELEKSLKAKEKENIKAFKAINLPAGYDKWDKKQLVEFWSVTALNASGLQAKGKAARNRIRAKINAMTVAAPAPAPATEEKPAPQEQPAAQAAQAASADTAAPAPVSVPDTAAGVGEQKLEVEDLETAPVRKDDSSTWIYVGILIVLIIIVIALVVYAARTMRENAKPQRPDRPLLTDTPHSGEEIDEIREKFGKTIAAKNEELAKAGEELRAAKERVAMLEENLAAVRSETAGLRKENSDLRAALEEVRQAEAATRKRMAQATAAVTAAAAPARGEAAPRKRSIYLGRVNADGIFVRADRTFNPAHDVYCLETADGLTGSFYVVPDATLAEMALITPVETLGGGCEGTDLADTKGFASIDTEMRGTARFDGRCWRIDRKARISYR